ncbi:MAG: hypothetical protein FVQ77_05030 [Cytophagales bacterium]|nr:hypothetical protein [Cytophagales bacterium]
MYNWSTDLTELKKDSEKYTIWKLEQLINYGLDEEKINEKELRKYWDKLSLDPVRRKFMALLLYGNKDS